MNGIRCALVDKNGVVVNYFIASPENDAVNSGKAGGDGLICVAHLDAKTGDTLKDGVFIKSAANIAAEQDAPAEVAARP